MKFSHPKVTLGMPVYNGAAYIEAALISVLTQTYTDFELVISDNASTDDSGDICRLYAEKDARVRYYRADYNHGAAWNFNRTYELARGEYFRWVAHDDMLSKTLLEKSVAVLDSHPDVVLTFSWITDIDGNDNEICVKKSNADSWLRTPNQRFKALSTVKPEYKCEEVFGLIRSTVLSRTHLIASYSDSDRTLLAELGLYGPFYEIEEPLFLHRIHERGSVMVNPDRQSRMAWFDTAKSGRMVFPNWQQLADLLSVIWRSPVTGSERVRCYLHMLTWVRQRRRHLWQDLVWAVMRTVRYYRNKISYV